MYHNISCNLISFKLKQSNVSLPSPACCYYHQYYYYNYDKSTCKVTFVSFYFLFWYFLADPTRWTRFTSFYENICRPLLVVDVFPIFIWLHCLKNHMILISLILWFESFLGWPCFHFFHSYVNLKTNIN